MAKGTCSVGGCTNRIKRRDLCSTHYEKRRVAGLLAPRPNGEALFWSCIRKTDTCWLWTAGCSGSGKHAYGVLSLGNYTQVTAHRFSWELANDRAVPDDMVVRHVCDVTRCVRPSHLALGTQAENMRDAKERDRYPRGTNHHGAVLTPELVIEARHAAATQDRFVLSQYARSLGIHDMTLSNAIRGLTWTHLNAIAAPVPSLRRRRGA